MLLKMKRTYIILLFSLALFAAPALHAQSYEFPDSFVQDSVGVLYGQSRAMVTVEGDQLMKTSSLSPTNSLYGLMPGISVMSNGGFNGNASFYFRGKANPLILVDGVERTLNSLANEEIENIVVLKDAASQALYGMKASAGLVLVTTKRGKPGKKFGVSYDYSLGTPTALPDWVDAGTYAEAVNFALSREGQPARYTPGEIDAYRNGAFPEYYPNVNWLDKTLRDYSDIHQFTLTANGGDDRIQYFSMLKYSNIQGLIKEAHAQPEYSTQLTHSALSVRTNLDIRVSRSTSAHVNLLSKIYENNTPGSVSATDLMTILYQLPSNAYPVRYDDGVWGGRNGNSLNPVAQSSYTGYTTYHTRTLYADLGIDQKLDFIASGLSAFAKGSVDIIAQNKDARSKKFLYQTKFGTLATDGTGNPYIEEGKTIQYGEEEYELGFSSSLNDMKRGTTIHTGFNYRKQSRDHIVNSSLFYRLSKYVGLGKGTTFANQGAYAFMDYGYKGKYSAALTLAYAGTNRLPAGSRWGFFPALSLGWRMDREFNLPSIQKLNLRASAGLVGNDNVTQDLEKYQFTLGSSFIFSNDMVSYPGMKESSLPSTYYTYEKSAKFNLGLDMDAWNLISFTVDGFYERNYDRLVSAGNVVSSMIGVTLSDASEGIVDYYGFETALSFHRKVGDWQFDVGGNFSLVKNIIINQNEVFRKYDYQKRTGHMTGQLWGLEVLGFFNSQEEIDNSPRQMFSEVYPGDYRYKDQNDDGVVDEYDTVPLGKNSTFPEMYYAFHLDLSYRNIGLSALFQGVGNYSVNLTTTGMYRPLINGANMSRNYWDNCWKAGMNTAIYPRPTTTGSDNNYRANSVFISDRSYLKLRNVELWYRIPSKAYSKLSRPEIKLFLRGTNLFSIDNIDVLDPEVLGVSYPLLRTFQTGLSLTF